MDEPRSNGKLRIAWKLAIVAALQGAATVGSAEDAFGKVNDGELRALLAQGWRDDFSSLPLLPAPRIVRPSASLIDATLPSLSVGKPLNPADSSQATAKPTLVDLIKQRSPALQARLSFPAAKILRPVNSPLLVPELAPLPPLRVAEPIELAPLGPDDRAVSEPVSQGVTPRVAAVPERSPGLYEFDGMLLGEGLSDDPN
jgi:hypothetical protein